jgi:uncharacterized SAM-binding protein YcdF (DUF218 family)
MRLVAVLGYSGRRSSELHAVCEARVRHAEGLEADAILLSGEAELMQGAWRGGEVVLDTRARNTRENARGVADAVRRLEADEVVVVTSAWHAFRARALVRAAIGDPAVEVTSSSPPGPRPVRLLAREAVCLVALPVQLLLVQRADQRVGRRPVGGSRGG